MNSKAGIIEKIIADGNAIVEKNLSEAKTKAESILNASKQTSADFASKSEKQAIVDGEEIIKRRKIVAKLDCNKVMLSKKKELVDDVFKEAISTLRKDKSKYITLISGMLERNADDGDRVVICEKDKAVITADLITKVAKKCGKKLSLSSEYGDFDGGFILENESFDKNLSLSLALADIRENIEGQVVEILFKESV